MLNYLEDIIDVTATDLEEISEITETQEAEQ